MAARHTPLWINFILVMLFISLTASAQPVLPDVAVTADKGVVILSWTCQYNGVKSITVLHSIDSIFNYTSIGKVKKTEKGTQAFVDGHPAPGKNYYKLSVLFSSGLVWSSNRCSATIEGSPGTAAPALPPNDSLQRYIVTTDTMHAARANTPAPATTKPAVKDPLAVDPEEDYDETTKSKKQATGTDDNEADANNTSAPQRKVYISFDLDTAARAQAHMPAQPDRPIDHKKITISFDDPSATVPTFIKSLYVFTDPVTGHVNMTLPNDVATHHYSIKFYDDQNHMIIEVPRINAAKIILDKRNFQRKGTFKFVLRKDVVELEQGYVEIK